MRNLNPERCTVDLTVYPDLVVIYLGMRANSLRGLWTLLRTGPEIDRAVAERPEGLLLHESFIVSLWPLHLGMRQYWRDFDALEVWTRTGQHRQWWQRFVRDPAGTTFWDETYTQRGGIEAIYSDRARPVGLQRFAPVVPARGAHFLARQRLGTGDVPLLPPVDEAGELSGDRGPSKAA